MKTMNVLVIERDDLVAALADFFARVLNDFDTTRRRLAEGTIHNDIPDLTASEDNELIRLYEEHDLGFALLHDHPLADVVLIDMGGEEWIVAAKKQ